MTESYKPKLIEVALPLAVISDASSRDKSIKHGHSDNLHQWWARRPLPSARAILWSALVDDPSGDPERFPSVELQTEERDRLFRVLEAMVSWDDSDNYDAIEAARAEIRRCFPDGIPPVLDPFGGGGSIPLEAQRLGLTPLSGDLNPVAVLIQRSMVDFPARFSGLSPVAPEAHNDLDSWSGPQGLAADVLAYGSRLSQEAQALVQEDYRSSTAGYESTTPLAWIWARTVPSPDPAWPGEAPLVSSWILRKKPGKALVWVCPIVDNVEKRVRYEIREGGEPPPPTINRGQGTCVATGTPIPAEYIRDCGRRGLIGRHPLATVFEGPTGRTYGPADGIRDPEVEDEWIPRGRLPEGGLGFRVQNYGMLEWADLFLPRQLRTLSTLTSRLSAIHEQVVDDALSAGRSSDGRRLAEGGSGAVAYADAIVTYLAFAIDKLADLNNSLTGWKKDAECPVHLFGRQAIPMVWDFAEANPFSGASGSFQSALSSVVAALSGKALRIRQPVIGQVAQRDARARVSEIGDCIVSCDPPYYDNVGYADLSDFFFVWMRKSLSGIWPNEMATLLAPKADELIADPSRHGSRPKAKKHFESGIAEFFSAVAQNQDPRVPATVFYAFKQSEEDAAGRTSTGWETFLQAIVDAGLSITATWPVRTENRSRLRAMGSNALASSVVLACRARDSSAPLETRGGLVNALRSEMPEALRLLQHENIAPVDLAQSAIGPGMRVFSRYSKVVEADGTSMSVRAALGLINEVLGEVLSSEESELDPDSRFALTWFEQYAHNPGPYGDADVLARAKDTSVGGIVEAGIAQSRDGKVRLLDRDELNDDWSPVTDSRSTVWEATQHLIRRLAQSETQAALLMGQLGGVADRARQLAYLLYGVCERKGWTDEAIPYNGIITAWPELTRQAATSDDSPSQQSLI